MKFGRLNVFDDSSRKALVLKGDRNNYGLDWPERIYIDEFQNTNAPMMNDDIIDNEALCEEESSIDGSAFHSSDSCVSIHVANASSPIISTFTELPSVQQSISSSASLYSEDSSQESI